MTVSSPPQRGPVPRRRRRVRADGELARLDHVEARPGRPGRWDLTLYFAPPDSEAPASVPPEIRPGHLRIVREDGTAIPEVWVEAVEAERDGAEEVLRARLVAGDPAAAARLAADPALYAVEITGVDAMDRLSARGTFSFSGLVPQPALAPRLPRLALPPLADIDYLARDFQSFRKLMLDRMALALPQWQERNAVDLGVAIIEVLAYAADHLSYYQDAVATEAYLETARQRMSVRRHARLLDYNLHEGCNSRVWVEIRTGERRGKAAELPEGTELMTGGRRPGTIARESDRYAQALAEGAQVFETLDDAEVREEHGTFEPYAWGYSSYALPAGTTRAALEGEHRTLRAGDVLVFRQVRLDRRTGGEVEGDPRLACVVRLARPPRVEVDGGTKITTIEWHPGDALPFPFQVVSDPEAGGIVETTRVFGNVVLADHGRTVAEELPVVPEQGRYRPVLSKRHLVYSEPFDPAAAGSLPALGAFLQDPGRAVPSLVLYEVAERYFYRHAEEEAAPAPVPRVEGLEALPAAEEEPAAPARPPRKRVPRRSRFDKVFEEALRKSYEETLRGQGVAPEEAPPFEMPQFDVWQPRKDLLWSGRFARDFVVEAEGDGEARLRFGDGLQGMEPAPGTRFWAVYRVGSPPKGNVGPGMITQLVDEGGLGLAGSHNCVPALGGTLPEDVESARRNAPQAFHSQQRCVTEDDYVTLAERHPEVFAARCVKSWNGSGVTAAVAVQRAGGQTADAAFLRRVDAWLRPFLVIGHELEVRPPDLVPLQIVLAVEVAPGHLRNPIRDDLLEVLGDEVLADGRLGRFHPDLLTFGQPVYLSDLVAAAMSVHGVVDVQALELHRWGRPQGPELELGRVEMDRLEIAVCRNDPAAPRLGVLELRLRGGR